MAQNELCLKYIRIFIVELAYWVISISMVFINKFVLSDSLLGGELTVFITMFQCLFALAILVTLNFVTKNCIDPCVSETTNDQIHSKVSLTDLIHVSLPPVIKFSVFRRVFPVSLLYVGMLVMNNFCLKYVGVAFYFVCRSLTTVFNVIFTYYILNEPTSRGALLCCVLIVVGFVGGIDQENVMGDISVLGVIFGVASSLFTSLFSIYTKKTLASLDKNIWALTLYNNINAISLFIPLIILHGDLGVLLSIKSNIVSDPTFWSMLSVSGIMAFLISTVTNASIKYTSPLTHNISGTAKACFQTVIAVLYYHDHKTLLWWTSNLTILFASAAYSRIKQKEMEQRMKSSPSEPSIASGSTDSIKLLVDKNQK
ncbi:GDP-fucose transporter 1, partial [Fragariocoptes setiger]